MQTNTELMTRQDFMILAEQLNQAEHAKQFLTANELEEITGYKAPYKQIEWLTSKGWIFIINGANHPKVHRLYMLQKFGIEGKDQAKTIDTWKPDLTKAN